VHEAIQRMSAAPVRAQPQQAHLGPRHGQHAALGLRESHAERRFCNPSQDTERQGPHPLGAHAPRLPGLPPEDGATLGDRGVHRLADWLCRPHHREVRLRATGRLQTVPPLLRLQE